MCLCIPCGQWEFALPTEMEEKYSSPVIVYIEFFFHEMGKDPKWTWPCYCGNWSGLMTKWHSSPSWRGFSAAWVSPRVGWYRRTRSQEGRTVSYPVSVVWGRGHTGRGGDRRGWPCVAPFPSISTGSRFHNPFFKHVFPSDSLCGW